MAQKSGEKSTKYEKVARAEIDNFFILEYVKRNSYFDGEERLKLENAKKLKDQITEIIINKSGVNEVDPDILSTILNFYQYNIWKVAHAC